MPTDCETAQIDLNQIQFRKSEWKYGVNIHAEMCPIFLVIPHWV